MAQPLQTHNHMKYDYNGKGWLVLFDDNNMKIYKQILSNT